MKSHIQVGTGPVWRDKTPQAPRHPVARFNQTYREMSALSASRMSARPMASVSGWTLGGDVERDDQAAHSAWDLEQLAVTA
jgi:hypothetical protein